MVKHAPIECEENWDDIEVKDCNDLTNIEEEKVPLSDKAKYKYDSPPSRNRDVIKHAPNEGEDNWDDIEVKDFNDLKNIDEQKVLFSRRESGNSRRVSDDEWKQDDANSNETKSVRSSKSSAWSGKAISEDVDGGSVGNWNHRSRSRSPPRRFTPPTRPQQKGYYRRFQADQHYSKRFHQQNDYSSNKRRSSPPTNTSPELYDMDDDPYYNGGQSSSHNEYLTSNRGEMQRTRYDAETFSYMGNSNVPRYCPRPPRHERVRYQDMPYDRRRNYY